MLNQDMENKSAEDYKRLNIRLQGKFIPLLTEQVNLRKGDTCIDLGCGTGDGSIHLSDIVGPQGKVIAIDPDAARISVAMKYNNRANIDYIVNKITNIEIESESIDGVISSFVLHWVPRNEKREIFAHVFNIMKKRAFFVTLVTEDVPVNVARLKRFWPEETMNKFHEILFYEDSKVYEDIAMGCGFEVVLTKYINQDFRFGSDSEYLCWLEASFNLKLKETFAEHKNVLSKDENGNIIESTVLVVHVFKKV